MAEPALVAECLHAMRAATNVPVTVKCRIGIDDQEPQEALPRLIESVVGAGIDTVIVHARKAWLKGLSPKENREIPPLDYPLVYEMKRAFPHLTIVINGGIASLEEADAHLEHVDGAMLGRAAYHSPWILLDADRKIFGEAGARTRREAVHAMLPYIDRQLALGTPLVAITRHMLGLYHGVPGARLWRRMLSEEARGRGAGCELIERALDRVERPYAPSESRVALAQA
jgi:tRNA-dihydrouridine synthase A